MTDSLLVERRGAVEWITMNRPERLNAFSPEMVAALDAELERLRTDLSVRVVVLRGSGRAFNVGLDIKEVAVDDLGSPEADIGAEGGEPDLGSGARLMLALRSLPQPVIALVHGPACGGGFALALAADIRIAGESARMNDAFVRLGVSGCELGMSYFLPRTVGLSVAAELMFTGRFIDAQRALQTGLVSSVVPDDELEATAEALAAEMLLVSPLALRKTKETLYRAMHVDDLEQVMAIEMATQVECLQGPDFAEGIRAMVEKRPPRFVT